MSYFPPPPSYDETVQIDPTRASKIIYCVTCGNPCKGEHLYCFQCGAALVVSSSSAPRPPPAFQNTVHVQPPPQPVHNVQPPPQPVHKPTAKVVTTQPTTANQSNVPVYNCLHDMSVRFGDRLIYDFEKIACCIGEVKGLDPKVKNNMHPEVNRKGVSIEEWREWMVELDEIQKKATSIVGCLCIFCFPGFIPQSILCAMFCPISMDHKLSFLPCCYGDWYAALRKWMEKVNGRLTRHGMYAKLLTYKTFNSAPRSKLYNQRITGKDHNYEMSFLAIALTEGESRKLMEESWDHGVNDKCTSGIGRCL